MITQNRTMQKLQYIIIYIQELDRYEAEGIDDNEEVHDDPAARVKAEKAIQRRQHSEMMSAAEMDYMDS